MKEMDADTKSTTFGAPMLLQLKLKLRKSDRKGARLKRASKSPLGRTSISDGNNITYDWTKSS